MTPWNICVLLSVLLLTKVNAQPADDPVNTNLFGVQAHAAQSFCESQSEFDNSFNDALPDNCRREYMDLMFIVDGSGSVGERNFEKVKSFLKLIVDTTVVGRDQSRIGLIQFSSNVRTEFPLNQYTNMQDVKNGIDRMRYQRGGTNIGQALHHALTSELVPHRGDRPNVKTVVITITDGRSEDDPTGAAAEMRARGFTTISIGIEGSGGVFGGPSLDNEQLLKVAGSRDRTFKVCDFNRLDEDVKNAIAAQICSETEKCRNLHSDMIFMVDGSGSIGAENFQRVKEFLKLIVDSVEVGPTQTRIGVVQFNHQPVTEMSLTQFTNVRSVKRAIDGIPWRRGRTRVGDALTHTLTREFLPQRGDRDSVENVVVVLTDGRSDDDPRGAAEQMRRRGVKTIAVGITDQIDKTQLDAIAGKQDRVFQVRDFARLNRRLKNAITSQICEGESGGNGNSGGGNGGSQQGPRYIGCFHNTNPSLLTKKLSNDFNQGPETCAQRCKAEGYPIAGSQTGYECYCGSYQGMTDAEKVEEERCNYNCPGDRLNPLKCGAYRLMSVYEVNGGSGPGPDPQEKEFEYLGCYQEYVPRKFPQFVVGAPLQTPKTCMEACIAEGKELAGLQVGSQCWCGDRGALAETEQLTQDKCIYKCAGDQNAECGGLLIMSVYGKKHIPTPGPIWPPRPGPEPQLERLCKSAQMDMLMVVDGSRSIGQANFNLIKDFLKSIVDLTDVTNDRTRVGVVQFNDNPYPEFIFTSYRTGHEVKSAIDRMRWRGGGSRMGHALDYVDRNQLLPESGARPEAQPVVIVLTDGRSNDDPTLAARRLHSRGAIVYAIGVTDRADPGQLRAVSGNNSRVATVRRFGQLNDNLRRLVAREICVGSGNGPAPPPEKFVDYIGCFKETVPRQMPQFVIGDIRQTPKTCLDACLTQGKNAAGIFVGSQCWCGNRADLKEVNRESPQDKCNFYKCVGNQTAHCGGIGFVMSAYQYKIRQPPPPPTPSPWSSWSTPQPWSQWGAWSPQPQPWNQWGAWSNGNNGGQWVPWSGSGSGGQGRRRSCAMDVVVVSDWSVSSRRYQDIMSTMMRAVNLLENEDVDYAVGIVDRNRNLRVLHNFDDNQETRNIRRVLLRSQFLNGRQDWPAVANRLRRGDNRDKVMIYIVGRDLPGQQLIAETRILRSRGVKIVPMYFGPRGLRVSPKREELRQLVGGNENLILASPTADEIVDNIRCRDSF